MRAGGNAQALSHTRDWGWIFPKPPPTPQDICSHTREPTPSHVYHKCFTTSAEDVRPRPAGPATPTALKGFHSLPGPDQPGRHDSTRRRPPARRASRAPPRPLCPGPERAQRAATPFSRRDNTARRNWAAGMARRRLVPIPSAFRVHKVPALLRCTKSLTAANGIPQPFPEPPRN